MLNGEGLRVVLWTSGCEHHCAGCHNPQTHCVDSGIEFDIEAKDELFRELSKDYVSGVTFSGGDPLHPANIITVANLIDEISELFPTKTIWIYTGYEYETIKLICQFDGLSILEKADVLVDGKYIKEKRDINAQWVGSTNQRVIDLKETREAQRHYKSNEVVVLYGN